MCVAPGVIIRGYWRTPESALEWHTIDEGKTHLLQPLQGARGQNVPSQGFNYR